MPQYHVKIVNKSGQVEEFDREYADLSTLKREIRQSGKLLVEAREKNKGKYISRILQDKLGYLSRSRPIRQEDIYNLFYELGTILKAGVPVMRALRMILDEAREGRIKAFLEHLYFNLKEGRNFSDILEESGKYYDCSSYIPVVRMGEKTGKLGESFLSISANIEKWMKIKSEIGNTLIYPMVLMVTGFLAVYVMLVYVIPRFADIVKSFKVVLPFHTRILFYLSAFLNNHQESIVLAFTGLLVILLILIRQPRFKNAVNNFLGKLPLVRTIKFSAENLRFLDSLSNLVSAGVPILVALELSLDSFGSQDVKSKLKNAALSLRKGGQLATALKDTGIFPPIVPNMVRVGEESGTLAHVLRELYDFMSEKFIKKTRKYMNFLEPLVIIFIALFIGMIIMTILPIIINISDINF